MWRCPLTDKKKIMSCRIDGNYRVSTSEEELISNSCIKELKKKFERKVSYEDKDYPSKIFGGFRSSLHCKELRKASFRKVHTKKKRQKSIENNKDKNSVGNNIKNTFILNKSYTSTAKSAIKKGFTTFSITARHIYEKNIIKFLNSYIVNYDNDFAKRFKNINEVHIIESIEDFNERNVFGSYILYRIINKKRQIVRIGYTADAIAYRLANYFSQAFSNLNKNKKSQFHLDIRDLGDIHNFNDIFKFQILCIANTKRKIKNLERLFTIYENRYDNELGYDLSLNDYYNRIIGDWWDYVEGDFKNSEVHPRLKIVPPEVLIDAVKECSTWDKILAKFNKYNKVNISDPITVKKKAIKYGFTIKGTGSIKDMRTFFIKPYLEDLVLEKNLDPEKIFMSLKRAGFRYLEDFATEIWGKQGYLRKLVRFIWKSDMEKIINFQKGQWLLTGLRRLLIYNKAKILMKNPTFNIISKAEKELIKQGISLRPKSAQYDGDLLKIFAKLKRRYKTEQNKVLAPLFATLLVQKDPDLSLGQIASAFGLINTVQNRKLLENLIIRIFKKRKFPRLENVKQIKLFLRDQFKN